MNKHCYRVVFNKARGMLMVVSEISKSQNKASGNSGSQKRSTAQSSKSRPSYKKLAMAIICAQSLIYQQMAWAANSQITNKAGNIPTEQRALLLQSNGIPVINIRTPNSNGLSHNTYSRFDIGSNGAVLNNSVSGAKTQLAGDIGSNLFLARGAANTILNEVRSTAPSKLNGNIEVGGQRADVIIANPAGLQINGAGFINANRAILTTGTPNLADGNIDSFNVQKGSVVFNNNASGHALSGGRGSAENRANYVDVLARAIQVNGQLNAKDSINLVTGSEKIDADTLLSIGELSGQGSKPTFAIDVTKLGQIQAHGVSLVGNEDGVGVRNAGIITGGTRAVLNNDGKVENIGTIRSVSQQNSYVIVKGESVTSTGNINGYGTIHVEADKNVMLDGGNIKKLNPTGDKQFYSDTVTVKAGTTIGVNNGKIENHTKKDSASISLDAGSYAVIGNGSIITSKQGRINIKANESVIVGSKASINGGASGINLQADKDIVLSDASIKKQTTADSANQSRNIMLIAGQDIKLDQAASIYNETSTTTAAKKPSNVVLKADRDVFVDNKSVVGSKGNIQLDADRNVRVLNNSIAISAGNTSIHSGSGTAIDSGKVYSGKNINISAVNDEVKATSDIVITNNTTLSAKKDISLTANDEVTITDVDIVKAEGTTRAQGEQVTVYNSEITGKQGIQFNSNKKTNTITDSKLNSSDGAVVATAADSQVTVDKTNIDANSTIISAKEDAKVTSTNIKSDVVNLASQENINVAGTKIANQAVSSKPEDIGSINIKSVGETNLTNTNIENTGNINLESNKHLTLIDTDIEAGKNLSLSSEQGVYNNAKRVVESGEEKIEYNTTTTNELTAGEVLAIDSKGIQVHNHTNLKGSSVLSNSESTHDFADEVNITATGKNNAVGSSIRGNVQIVNKGNIDLDSEQKIIVAKDLVLQADKTIHIRDLPDVTAESIQLKTNTARTDKNADGIFKSYGEGDIVVLGTNLTSTSTAANSMILDSANYIKIHDTNLTSEGSATVKSQRLMQVNNSRIKAGENLILDSKHQLITNGQRLANTNDELQHLITAGKTNLEADKVVSIRTKEQQAYMNTDIKGGAVLLYTENSNIGLNNNSSISAQNNTKLGSDNTPISGSNNTPRSDLNGDLSISTNSSLTIDPNKLKLDSTGDMSLTSRNGTLKLVGQAGKTGLGSETVVKLQTGGNINLAGKDLLIEGSDIRSNNGNINLVATGGSVELKGVKNSFTNSISQYKINVITEQLNQAKSEFAIRKKEYIENKELLEYGQWAPFMEEYTKNWTDEDWNKLSTDNANTYRKVLEIGRSQEYKEAKASLTRGVELEQNINELNYVLDASRSASTGYEHKDVNLTARRDVNIVAKSGGILLEATDINANNILIKADGNLATTTYVDEVEIDKKATPKKRIPDKHTSINNDSIRITGLADIYTRGQVDKDGKITGSNYSYHQLINQSELSARGNIEITGGGRFANSRSKRSVKESATLQLIPGLSQFDIKEDITNTIETNNNAVILNSANLSAGGKVKVDATKGDLLLEASQVSFMDGSKSTSTKRSWYGKKKVTTTTKVRDNSNAVTTDIRANNIALKSDGDIKVYGSQLEANSKGSVDITAGKGLYLYAIEDRTYSSTDVKKRSTFLRIRYNKDHTNDTRSEIRQLPTKLVGGQAYTKSGHNTILQGTVFDTLNKDDIQVGVGKYASKEAKLILAPIVTRIQTTHTQEKDNLVWMKNVNQGKVTTTGELPKFNQTPSIQTANGIDIHVPVDVTIKDNEEAKKRLVTKDELGKIALELSKQSGYEYLADLDKRNDINWKQVELIQKNWDYTQEGLTPAGAALIALAVTIATGGSGAGVGASIAGSVGVTSTAGVAAANAAFASLASQASVTLINNKGDISKTLDDLGSSETIRKMATAALTAGISAELNIAMPKNPVGADKFYNDLANGVTEGFTNAIVDVAVNGASLEDALKTSMVNSLVDALSASVYSYGVKKIDLDGTDFEAFARDFAHKVAAAGVGCVSAEAKGQSCDAGALGAAVGEMVGDFMVEKGTEWRFIVNPDEKQDIINTAKLIAGTVAVLAEVDVNVAANSAGLAVENNAAMPSQDPAGTYPGYTPTVRNGNLFQYYNDMTIVSFSAGMAGYTVIFNNKNGNIWVSGYIRDGDVNTAPDLNFEVNPKTLAEAVKLADDGKITRPIGLGASINFGSIRGGSKTAKEIDSVISGGSVGVQVCQGVCIGGMYTKNGETVVTYGAGTSQVGLTGGRMRLATAQEESLIKHILGTN